MVDYDNSTFEEVWDYELKGNLEKRSITYYFLDGDVTGKFYDDINGIIYYKQNNYFHREDGPAVIDSYRLMWYQFGEYHREDGPAVIYLKPCWGEIYDAQYYIHGKLISKEFFNLKINRELQLNDGNIITIL
ncbi:MAG: hypothetical protein ACOCV1_03115 [Bacillota bacterium]